MFFYEINHVIANISTNCTFLLIFSRRTFSGACHEDMIEIIVITKMNVLLSSKTVSIIQNLF